MTRVRRLSVLVDHWSADVHTGMTKNFEKLSMIITGQGDPFQINVIGAKAALIAAAKAMTK